MVAFGEFVLVEDGRCGVLVVTPTWERLAVWFGEEVDDQPVVELVDPESVRRPAIDVPDYYDYQTAGPMLGPTSYFVGDGPSVDAPSPGSEMKASAASSLLGGGFGRRAQPRQASPVVHSGHAVPSRAFEGGIIRP